MESGLPRFRPGFTCPALLRCQLVVLCLSHTGLSPCAVPFSNGVLLNIVPHNVDPTTPKQKLRFGLFPFRSPLLRKSLLISFPLPTEMFQFGKYRLTTLCIQIMMMEDLLSTGFPHSDTSGSKLLPAPRSVSSVFTSFFAY